MSALEEELKRQMLLNDALRMSLSVCEARLLEVQGRVEADKQLAELRQAVKEGTSSERVKYGCCRVSDCLCVFPVVALFALCCMCLGSLHVRFQIHCARDCTLTSASGRVCPSLQTVFRNVTGTASHHAAISIQQLCRF